MINKFDRIAALTVLAAFFLFALIGAMKAQSVVRRGNTFVQQVDSTSRGGATKTQYLYTDSKGVTDTVYLSSRGKAFIWKTSKNNKRYRKYLPEVTKQIEAK